MKWRRNRGEIAEFMTAQATQEKNPHRRVVELSHQSVSRGSLVPGVREGMGRQWSLQACRNRKPYIRVVPRLERDTVSAISRGLLSDVAMIAEASMAHQQQLGFDTQGRGTREITAQINEVIAASGVRTGICQLFILHTSASLLLTENADPQVRQDLETFLADLAPDGDRRFVHDDEGPDDMPAHVRTVLTESSLTVPVSNGRMALGTWQGIFLYEHRTSGHARKVMVTVIG